MKFKTKIDNELWELLINNPFNKKAINKLLESEANVNSLNENFETVLIFLLRAFYYEHWDFENEKQEKLFFKDQIEHVEELLKYEIDINFLRTFKYNALFYAINTRNFKLVKLLVKNGAELNAVFVDKYDDDNKDTILDFIQAEKYFNKNNGNKIDKYLLKIEKLLIKNGAKQFYTTKGYKETKEKVLVNYDMALFYELVSDKIDKIKVAHYLKQSANINYINKEGHNAISYLLEQNIWFDYSTEEEFEEEFNKQYNNLKYILSLGIDVDFLYDEENYFQAIQYTLNYKLIELFVNAGTDINRKDSDEGLTILCDLECSVFLNERNGDENHDYLYKKYVKMMRDEVVKCGGV